MQSFFASPIHEESFALVGLQAVANAIKIKKMNFISDFKDVQDLLAKIKIAFSFHCLDLFTQ